MTTLVALLVVVTVVVLAAQSARRLHQSSRLARKHHKALDTLGQLASEQAGDHAPDPEQVHSHVKILRGPPNAATTERTPPAGGARRQGRRDATVLRPPRPERWAGTKAEVATRGGSNGKDTEAQQGSPALQGAKDAPPPPAPPPPPPPPAPGAATASLASSDRPARKLFFDDLAPAEPGGVADGGAAAPEPAGWEAARRSAEIARVAERSQFEARPTGPAAAWGATARHQAPAHGPGAGAVPARPLGTVSGPGEPAPAETAEEEATLESPAASPDAPPHGGRSGSGPEGRYLGAPSRHAGRTPAGHRPPGRRHTAVAAAAAVVLAGGAAAGALLSTHSRTPASAAVQQRGHRPAPRTSRQTPAPSTTAPPAVPVSSASGTTVYRVGGPVPVELTGTGRCWVEVRQGDATGAVLFVGIIDSGQQQSFTAPVWIRLGNPPAITVSVAGTALSQPYAQQGAPYNLEFELSS